MLIGSVAANRLSSRFHAGTAICLSFLFMVIAIVPILFTDSYWVVLASYSLMGLPVPLINSMMLGFLFSKTDESLQGRVSTAVSIPVQALSMLCGGLAGTLIPTTGFVITAGLFITGILFGTLIAATSSAIRTIPQAAKWPETQL